MEASASPPSGATNTAKGGMTMQQLLGILRLAYHTTSFGDPTAPPFSYTAGAGSLSFADAVGFLSLEPGGAVWGLRCPEGAVVASDSSTMPYCRQIEAGREPWKRRVRRVRVFSDKLRLRTVSVASV